VANALPRSDVYDPLRESFSGREHVLGAPRKRARRAPRTPHPHKIALHRPQRSTHLDR
jgi:hypothetical protein